MVGQWPPDLFVCYNSTLETYQYIVVDFRTEKFTGILYKFKQLGYFCHILDVRFESVGRNMYPAGWSFWIQFYGQITFSGGMYDFCSTLDI